jgi:CRISP-associated protein Cas1
VGVKAKASAARHSFPSAKAVFILVFAARRRDRHSVLSSEDTARLADDAAVLRERSIKLRKLQNDPRFSRVLAAKSVRGGLKNKVAATQLQKQEAYRFFKGGLATPPRIVMLDGNGSISFDVLSSLSEQNVPLIRTDWQGNVQSVLANTGYAANPYRLEWQLETRADPRQRMAFCIDLIKRKIDSCINTLEKSIRRSPAWEQAIKRAYADLTRLECDPLHDVVSLRALEAGSAAAYFKAWREVLLQWRGLNQRPIPESWHRIGSRTSLFKLVGNRNAAHPINATLNYAYGILESQIRIKSVAEGYDPTLGIMHESREGSSAFVFDMMEPERPKVDCSILEFVKSHTFHAADFVIQSDGVCRLNGEKNGAGGLRGVVCARAC